MNYTIDELFDMDFGALSDNQVLEIDKYITKHYWENDLYTELLSMIRFEMDLRNLK